MKDRTTFLVLLALSHSKMHGYEISKFIDAKTNGFFRLPFGSLYPVLHKLEKEKLIGAEWDDSAKPRKVYSLTARGRKSVEEEVEGFRSYSKAVGRLIAEGSR